MTEMPYTKGILKFPEIDNETREKIIKLMNESNEILIIQSPKVQDMAEKSRKVNESQIDFLKPCPCCGSIRIHVVAPDGGCYCWDCGLTMPNRPDWRGRWNRRVKE